MKNKAKATAHLRVALAATVFGFTWASTSAAEMAGASKLTSEFQTFANSDLLVLGPVDAVDQPNARVQVLGQWIPLSASQKSEDLVGHVVAVYGSVASDGSLEVAEVREQSSTEYVAGATRVYLKGSIAELDKVHGTARVGSLSINYSGALHTLVSDDLAVGTVASFEGVRYTETNKLYADSGLAHQAANGIQTRGQTGSGAEAMGQTGSGFQTAGQTGSGMKSLGQTGSGFRAAGQTGSGARVLGQTGSGFNVAGQTGSGARVLGQTGSGFNVAGQTGSGARVLGQTGSGAKVLGQTGSGARVLGQTGSGMKALGQTGSGARVLGQTGSGARVLGQTGSGFQAAGQTGSGAKVLGQTGSGFRVAGQTGSGR